MENALEVCEYPSNQSVYFDNIFLSYQLISALDKRFFQAIGTMRKDRVMKCPLIDIKQIKRKERVSHDYINNFKKQIVRWNDNSVVTLGSNTFSAEPVGTVKRWVKGIERVT